MHPPRRPGSDSPHARTSNDYGKTDEELDVILRWNAVLEPRYRERGATIIDAGRPLPDVVEDVRAAGRRAS